MDVVEVDARDVFAGFEGLSRAARDLSPVFREIKADLRADIRNHFEERKGPSGSWQGLAQSTIEKITNRRGARTKGGKLRARTIRRLARPLLGRLKTAWEFTYDRSALTATSLVSWARAHQEGAIVGHGANLPARPFAFASSWLAAKFLQAVRLHLGAAWEGR